jgi:hypothetical protein
MEIKIYNQNQIGGCFTFIKTSKAAILIDYGMALPGTTKAQEEFDFENEKVDAVFITHYHGDHVGRILEIPKGIPVYMGTVTKSILLNIYERLARIPNDEQKQKEHQKYASLLKSDRIKTVEENKEICDIEGIKITPYTVDHSAYDAYMYLIEADAEVCLHTGDFRRHGYRGGKMLDVIKYYVHKNGRKVDYLIIEGTMVGNRKDEKVKTEFELQKGAEEIFRNNKYAFLIISSTNLDSLASFYNAAQKNSMRMYCYSNYVCAQLRTFSATAGKRSRYYKFEKVYAIDFERELYHEKWKKSKTQKEMMDEYGFLCIIKAEEKYHEWIAKFKDKNPIVIYSLWNGYLNPRSSAYNEEWDEFLKVYKESGQFIELHTSGHADIETLAKVIEAVSPTKAIIPMHTENLSGFAKLNISEDLKTKVRGEKNERKWKQQDIQKLGIACSGNASKG